MRLSVSLLLALFVSLLAANALLPRLLPSAEEPMRATTVPAPPPAARGAPARVTPATVAAAPGLPQTDGSEGRLYRWRDARGSVHIHSEPPPASVGAEIIPFVRRPPGTLAGAAARAPRVPLAPQQPAPALPPHPLSVYTPEGFDGLLDRLEDTARQLEERNRYMEELAQQL